MSRPANPPAEIQQQLEVMLRASNALPLCLPPGHLPHLCSGHGAHLHQAADVMLSYPSFLLLVSFPLLVQLAYHAESALNCLLCLKED